MRNSPAERQLILLSAGTAERRAQKGAQASRLAAAVDWQDLAQTLRLRKLLPALGPRIVELADGSANTEFVTAVEQALEAGRRQGAFLQLICLRLVSMLADAGIRATPLKGPLLSESIYQDLGRRLSSDVDLLVAPEDLRAAVDVVRELGYDAPDDPVDRNGLPLLHFALIHGRGELPPVEIHWRIHWYEQTFSRERLLPPAVDYTGQWHPAPVDELAALLLFYARDGFIDLRLAADLSAWWDVHGSDLPRGALGELLAHHPELERAIVTGVAVTEQTVGLPAERVLESVPSLGRRGRMVVRLANPNPHSSQSQLYADIGLIDGLLAPRGGFGAFVRRQVFPPREVLDQQARHGARRRRRTSLGRGTGVLARYGLTMTRLVRTPETLR